MLESGFYPKGNRKPPQTTNSFQEEEFSKTNKKTPMRIGKLLKINLSTKDTRALSIFKIRDSPTMSRNGQNN